MQVLAVLIPALAPLQGEPPPAPPAEEQRGLLSRADGAFEGYTLFCPLRDTTTYLIDMDGDVVHTWESDLTPGNSVYLMDDGHLIRCGRLDNDTFSGGGQGGRVRELDWEGNVLWDWSLCNDRNLAHHDVEPLPNGNLLVIAWELVATEAAVAAGRDAAFTSDEGFWPDVVLEIRPVPPDGAEVVWEWHAFEHVVQDRDPALPGYGSPADNPELVDLNGDHRRDRPLTEEERLRQQEIEDEMRALGYLGDDDADDEGEAGPDERRRTAGDWLHTNSVDYRADLDLIVLSVRRFHELWVIDHSTTPAEARGHAGGRWGRGGDLVWRWGNPVKHGAGEEADQLLFGQHDAQWIPEGCPGAGNLLVFNNGEGRPGGSFSSVDEVELPLDAEGRLGTSPDGPLWSYAAPEKESFFSSFISGAQRLPNGNTLICEGARGRVFEVTRAGEIVWEYLNPFGSEDLPEPVQGGPRRGAPPPGAGKGPGGRPPPGGRGPGQRIPHGLFRATRLAPDHPGLAGRDLGAQSVK